MYREMYRWYYANWLGLVEVDGHFHYSSVVTSSCGRRPRFKNSSSSHNALTSFSECRLLASALKLTLVPNWSALGRVTEDRTSKSCKTIKLPHESLVFVEFVVVDLNVWCWQEANRWSPWSSVGEACRKSISGRCWGLYRSRIRWDHMKSRSQSSGGLAISSTGLFTRIRIFAKSRTIGQYACTATASPFACSFLIWRRASLSMFRKCSALGLSSPSCNRKTLFSSTDLSRIDLRQRRFLRFLMK